MMKKILLILLAVSASNHVESARILAAVPTASYSHQMFFQLLWRELAIQGHEIVVLTTDPTHENLTNFKEIDMSSAYTLSKKGIADVIALNDNKMAAFKRFSEIFHEVSDYELALPEVQQLIQDENEHFDLVMIEYLYPSFYAFKHRFNCPFIGVTSLDGMSSAHAIMGNPTNAVLYPSSLLSGKDDLSFKDRLTSFFLNGLVAVTRNDLLQKINALNQKHFGDGYPDTADLMESVDMLFVNANPMFAPIRPLSPSTISVAGGMHMKAPQPLPKDLKQFLDDSPQGVIYFSMGSNVKSKDLSNQTLHTIMQTFSQVPYNILWKFESDELPGKPDNVKIIKWAPQQDVLKHKNIKLFITQAGMQSLEEALFSHVPLITIPFLGDQNANAEKVAKKEIGMQLNHKTLTVDEFTATILEVITNPKYKNNMKALALQIQDQPMTPLERAVWWTEYILRHKSGKHLRGPSAPAYQYYYLDIFAFLGACLLMVCMGVYFLGKFLYTTAVKISQRVTIKIKRA